MDLASPWDAIDLREAAPEDLSGSLEAWKQYLQDRLLLEARVHVRGLFQIEPLEHFRSLTHRRRLHDGVAKKTSSRLPGFQMKNLKLRHAAS